MSISETHDNNTPSIGEACNQDKYPLMDPNYGTRENPYTPMLGFEDIYKTLSNTHLMAMKGRGEREEGRVYFNWNDTIFSIGKDWGIILENKEKFPDSKEVEEYQKYMQDEAYIIKEKQENKSL